jgi:hypothetical protein
MHLKIYTKYNVFVMTRNDELFLNLDVTENLYQ